MVEEELEKQVKNLTAELDETTASLAHVSQKHANEKSELQGEIKRLEAKCAGLQSKYDEAHLQNAELRKKVV